MSTLDVTLLPAGQGDSILLEYGDLGERHRVLVDGGPARCYADVAARLAELPADRRRVDLLVLTHVDADHVEGVIKLVNDAGLAVEISEVWFNGYEQLPPDDELGAPQGEILSALLSARGIPLNTRFDGQAVARRNGAALPRAELPGGLALTVLGPDLATLRALRAGWEKECRRAGIAPGSTRDALELLAARGKLTPLDSYLEALEPEALAAAPETAADASVTNASSIVLLAEYDGRSVLLTGDATPTVLTGGLERLLAERNRSVLDVNAVKLPHHGSRRNVTHEVLDLLRSPAYLVSSDGSYFHHPDAEAIARVVTRGKGASLLFNYRTEVSDLWSDAALAHRLGYQAYYPEDPNRGVTLQL
jgi:beta-lactamase superfamily II metal-dependent hydrolase